MESKNRVQMNLSKNRNRIIEAENELVLPGIRVGVGINWEIVIHMYSLYRIDN